MKKKLSILSLLFGLFVCVTLFSACGGDDDKKESPASNPLVGTWRAEVVEKGEQQYWDLTFNADFSWSVLEYNKEDKTIIHNSDGGTYKFMDDTTIILTNSKGKVESNRFTITDGKKLQFLDHDRGKTFYKI